MALRTPLKSDERGPQPKPSGGQQRIQLGGCWRLRLIGLPLDPHMIEQHQPTAPALFFKPEEKTIAAG